MTSVVHTDVGFNSVDRVFPLLDIFFTINYVVRINKKGYKINKLCHPKKNLIRSNQNIFLKSKTKAVDLWTDLKKNFFLFNKMLQRKNNITTISNI